MPLAALRRTLGFVRSDDLVPFLSARGGAVVRADDGDDALDVDASRAAAVAGPTAAKETAPAADASAGRGRPSRPQEHGVCVTES